jgi:hypothetical protein
VKTADTALSALIQQDMGLEIPAAISLEEIRAILMQHLAHLIDHNYERLVFLLYRIDVDESKMRSVLEQQQGKDAAGLIADLIIERQLQKIKTRQEFSDRDKNIDENDKW